VNDALGRMVRERHQPSKVTVTTLRLIIDQVGTPDTPAPTRVKEGRLQKPKLDFKNVHYPRLRKTTNDTRTAKRRGACTHPRTGYNT